MTDLDRLDALDGRRQVRQVRPAAMSGPMNPCCTDTLGMPVPCQHAARAAAPPVETRRCIECGELEVNRVHHNQRAGAFHYFIPPLPSPDREVGLREARRAAVRLGEDLVRDHRGIPYDVIERVDEIAALLDSGGLDVERLVRLVLDDVGYTDPSVVEPFMAALAARLSENPR